MLADYKNIQKEFYSEIVQAVQVYQRVSHAYLIETMGFADSKNLIFSFAKFLLCKDHYSSKQNCGDCSICHLVDTGIESDIVVIEPDGQWIKKEQMLQLKETLKSKSVFDQPRIYIIFQADRLNKAAANSMLKFLEEPELGIIAILVTSQKYHVIPTILSRCQIYSLVNPSSVNCFSEEKQDVIDFAMNLERMGTSIIAYLPELWHNKYKTKDDYSKMFNDLEIFYHYLLHLKIESNELEKNNYEKELEYILSKNTLDCLLYKVKVIGVQKNKLDNNANMSLLLDRFVIEFCGGEN